MMKHKAPKNLRTLVNRTQTLLKEFVNAENTAFMDYYN